MIKQENLDFFLVQIFGQPPLEPEESKSFLGVLASGGVCVIDFHITPGEERQAGASIGQRATGG